MDGRAPAAALHTLQGIARFTGVCSMSRYLLIAAFAGVAGSSLSGSDEIGVLAAAIAVLVTLAAARLFPAHLGQRSCSVPAQQAPAPPTDGRPQRKV